MNATSGPSWGRWAIYGILLALAIFFLTPLVIVVLTSLRPNEEMAQRSLIGWPDAITLQPVRAGFPCFGAALVGYVEATRVDR